MTANDGFATNVAKLRLRARLAASVHMVFLGAVIGGMAVTCIETGIRFRQQPTASASALFIVAGLVGVGAVWHLISTAMSYAAAKPRVVPYFNNKYFKNDDPARKTSEESQAAFNGGYGIASDLPALDALACELQVTPLSSFGFGDDLFKQRPQWSELTAGIRTMRALAVKASVRDGQFSASTASELEVVARALDKAQETHSAFSLIVRYGRDDFISGAEMNQREGTFWC